MNQEQLNAIKERVAKATPGEWRCMETGHIRTHYSVGNEEEYVAHTYDVNDAEFIAHSHKDVPALIAEVERLQKRLAQTEKCYEIMERATFKATDKMTHFKNALEQVMEVEAPSMETWETQAHKIAREALGGEAHE